MRFMKTWALLLATATAACASSNKPNDDIYANIYSHANPSHLKFLMRRQDRLSQSMPKAKAKSKSNIRSLNNGGSGESKSLHFESYTMEQWTKVAEDMEQIQHKLDVESSTRVYEGPTNLQNLADFTGENAKREHFVSQCTNFLLSDDITSNNKISQVDSTHFLIYYSILVGVCPGQETDPCTKVIFEAIPVELQLAFVWAICPFDATSGGDNNCLKQLDEQGEEFGWIITGTKENWEFVSQEVANYCATLWLVDQAAKFHGGTDAPTITVQPSVSPTQIPTVSPTDGPTKSPIASPTNSPSASPTNVPSLRPTSRPSISPSDMPTAHPSVQPTDRPSGSPSALPTSKPSLKPTGHPTPSPSASPTAQPSVKPTLSHIPTKGPTPHPTFIGSWHPSVSKEPTGAPTRSPTSSPTVSPTASPSKGPTSEPTATPTHVPSKSPSALPTSNPTSSPSDAPTTSPTDTPTTHPSHSPTTSPSSTPSHSPSTSPFGAPSHFPTTSPTESPSIKASSSPTDVHSVVPTSSPTDVPTSRPTVYESSQPSMSIHPSSSPTFRDPFDVSFTYMMGFDNANITAQTLDDAFSYMDVMDEVRQGIRTVLASSGVEKRRRSPGRTLTEEDERMEEYKRKLNVVLLTSDPLGSIFHRNIKDDECPEEFTASSNCVRVVTEVLVFANAETYTQAEVSQSVWKPMRSSMSDDQLFVSSVNGNGRGPGSELKEAKYLADGPSVPPSTDRGLPEDDRLLSGQAYAGIAVGSIFLVGFLLLFAFGRSRADDDRVTREIDENEALSLSESDYSEQGGDGPILDIEIGKRDMSADSQENRPLISSPQSIEGSSTFEAESVSKAAQFDIDTGAVIAPILSGSRSASGSESGSHSGSSSDGEHGSGSGSSQSENSSSVLSDSQGSTDEYAEALIGRLDTAVSNGDWAAVAAIAGDLSTADEASTFSSVHSKYSTAESKGRERERSALSKEDKQRAETIDRLVSIGDWNAVGATAAAFDSDSSMSGAERSNTANVDVGSGSASGSGSGEKKSILDFIAGPWQSKAASKVMAQDIDGSGDEEKQGESDEISTLSGGFSPARNAAIDTEYAMTAAATAPPNNANLKTDFSMSESSTTEDDRKALLPPITQRKKRGWKGRIPFLGGKFSPNKDEGASRSLALQEDSSASSWSHGSSPVESFSPYENIKNDSIETKKSSGEDEAEEGEKMVQDEDVNMPPEMKAFGEDHGLAAAEYAMHLEDISTTSSREADDENSNSPMSKASSINSLQNDLDRAIESGDWAAVEAQTNKMFNMSLEVENINTESGGGELMESADGATSFEDSSFVDEDSRAGWSTGSKSHTTTDSEQIDDERIAMLEKLIETDDWQGIVTASRIHYGEDSSMATSTEAGDQDDGLLSLGTEEGDLDKKIAAVPLVSETEQDVEMKDEAEISSDDAMLEDLPPRPDFKEERG